MLKELESMTYEEALQESSVFSLLLTKKSRDEREGLTSSQQKTLIKKAV